MTSPSLASVTPGQRGTNMADTTSRETSDKGLTHVIYALYALSVVTGGFTAIVAIIMNYVKRDDVRGTWLATHFRWQMRTFWYGLVLGIVGLVSLFFVVGIVVLVVDAIWILYRVIKGWLYLYENKPMYATSV
jgi:uncharacterized membrane protein